MNAHVLQLLHGLRAVLFDGVRHSNDAEEFPLSGKIQRRLALIGKPVCQVCQVLEPLDHVSRLAALRVEFGENEFLVAAHDPCSVDHSRQAVSGKRPEILNLLGLDAACVFHDGPRQRVLTLGLQRACQIEQLFLIYPFRGDHLCHNGMTAGDRAGLVQRHDLHVSSLLQHLCCLKEDAMLGAHSVADHDRHRRCEAECAGAAHNEVGNTSCQRRSDRRLHDQEPDQGHDNRNSNNCRHENA